MILASEMTKAKRMGSGWWRCAVHLIGLGDFLQETSIFHSVFMAKTHGCPV